MRVVKPGELEAERDAQKKTAKPPSCMDHDDELLAGEIAAKGLNPNKRWYRCTAEHGQHPFCEPKRESAITLPE